MREVELNIRQVEEILLLVERIVKPPADNVASLDEEREKTRRAKGRRA